MKTALVLGAAVHAGGPSPTLLRRTRHAAALFHAGRVDRLVLCGGLGRFAPTEAEAMRTILLAEGVPEHALVLEDQSTTTAENIRNALPVLDGAQIIVVTDHYHALRGRLTARAYGLDATSSSPAIPRSRPSYLARMYLREGFALPVYLWRLRHVRKAAAGGKKP